MEGKTKWLTTTKNIKERDLAEVGHNKRVSQMRAILAARRELAGVQNWPSNGLYTF